MVQSAFQDILFTCYSEILPGRSIADTKDASVHDREPVPGDVWRNEPCLPHQIVCLESGSIVEVSTPDGVEDNYRVFPGDSQKWSREA